MASARDCYAVPDIASDEIHVWVVSTPDGERMFTREVYALTLDLLDTPIEEW